MRAAFGSDNDAISVSGAGKPLSYNTVEANFLRLARSIGLRVSEVSAGLESMTSGTAPRCDHSSNARMSAMPSAATSSR